MKARKRAHKMPSRKKVIRMIRVLANEFCEQAILAMAQQRIEEAKQKFDTIKNNEYNTQTNSEKE